MSREQASREQASREQASEEQASGQASGQASYKGTRTTGIRERVVQKFTPGYRTENFKYMSKSHSGLVQPKKVKKGQNMITSWDFGSTTSAVYTVAEKKQYFSDIAHFLL